MKQHQKLYSLETLYKITYDLKKQGKRVGLTHGAFDMFHYSHLDLLRKSGFVCDYLIVGVDSDESITNYKSYKRPIIDQNSRLQIIGEIESVDAVFLKHIELKSDSRINLYKNLMADIITIGQNYAIDNEIRSDSTKAGSRLIKFDTDQRYTTTKIIDSILSKYNKK